MNYSPLRYPGGKSKIAPLIRLIMEKAEESRDIYTEPFAGGAGVALSLLIEGTVDQIVINDYDKACLLYTSISQLKRRLYSNVPGLPASTSPHTAECQSSFGMTAPDKRISE